MRVNSLCLSYICTFIAAIHVRGRSFQNFSENLLYTYVCVRVINTRAYDAAVHIIAHKSKLEIGQSTINGLSK